MAFALWRVVVAASSSGVLEGTPGDVRSGWLLVRRLPLVELARLQRVKHDPAPVAPEHEPVEVIPTDVLGKIPMPLVDLRYWCVDAAVECSQQRDVQLVVGRADLCGFWGQQ